mmetsp:Transcript_17727/g.26775  ORF Transcript_17727/g.26775 Transcript_17727/m.26775 type:complete len:196 (+) Transcript_17727:121-708(+)|eukprot:CAMPEP_0194768574 /NCGR_PEP_ID=MMETSP0323_2-20130528/40052_1 /TAXON_ID=2866 ORGANISM="Crypthecodinium cohnii, Strain Seligo" /NCGR_SAMPLE_ID=MMETSP0323_2 /ASSEMBLY_ACC=CAM_ASM_000346 /LENGTH=195 /DNA_ID=CAMNT_0039701045 /DNA_START=156 /DNA_END=743 /DNA_ORIENTATION=+
MASEAASSLLETATLEALASAAAEVNRPTGDEEEEEKKEPTPPPEDLELRKKLQDFIESHEKASARQELTNCGKILQKLIQDFWNEKLHEMRCDILERMVGKDLFFVFDAANFEETQIPSMRWRGEMEPLKSTFHEVQRAADSLLDPDSVSFAQVTELVKQNRILPGIEDVDDKVEKPVAPKESSLERPKKPWEK